jgi:hypothetical protein
MKSARRAPGYLSCQWNASRINGPCLIRSTLQRPGARLPIDGGSNEPLDWNHTPEILPGLHQQIQDYNHQHDSEAHVLPVVDLRQSVKIRCRTGRDEIHLGERQQRRGHRSKKLG